MQIKGGCTRHVILISKYAIKIPRLNYGWRLFLQGLLGNMQEVLFSKMNDERICPIIFNIWGGWLLIMPRCKELTEQEFNNMDYKRFKSDIIDFNVPVEHKQDSFGWYKDKIVAIDYGS